MYSLIIPIYKNAESLPELLGVVTSLNKQLNAKLEIIFVIDGSPDNSYMFLNEELPKTGLNSKIIVLSRNFGSFAAIREGLAIAKGDYFAVMAADLQEPPELVLKFFRLLTEGKVDVVFGTREQRDDPFFSRLAAIFFWYCYRKFVQ